MDSADIKQPFARVWQLAKEALRQPLLQFALLGGLIFLVAGGPSNPSPDTTIVVDAGVRSRLAQLYRAQLGADPSKVEMDALVARYVRDEMLYREALRMGLDQGDEIIRRRLIQKMEFLAESRLAEVPDAKLKSFFAANRDQFGAPARSSFRQLYFDPDKAGWDKAEARAAAALKAGNVASADRSPVQGEYALLGPQDAVQLFGDSPLSKALFTAPLNTWSGPYRSGLGWHLIYVTRRDEAEIPPFDEVKDAVAQAYAETRREERIDEVLAGLKKRYTVKEVAGQ